MADRRQRRADDFSYPPARFNFSHVVASDVFITEVDQFGAMNSTYRPRFQNATPVRATIGIDRLANGNALVEIILVRGTSDVPQTATSLAWPERTP